MKKNAQRNTGISAQPHMKPSIEQATKTNALQNMIKNVTQYMIRNAKQCKYYFRRGTTYCLMSNNDRTFN